MKFAKCRTRTLLFTLFSVGILIYTCLVIQSFNASDENLWNGSAYSKKNTSVNPCDTSHPKRIHQIFFYVNGNSIPKRMLLAQATWKNTPGFNYTMWTEQMMLDLIASDYPGLLTLYKSYGHWVRQIDVARYVILHRYGGVFVDMDIEQRDSNIKALFNSIPNCTSSVMYQTKPFGFATDFIVSKPGDSFIEHVISGLPSAHRSYILPYLTTMLSTGPAYLTLRYKTFPNKDVVFILDDNLLSTQYIRHMEGGTWHQLDGKIIWWIFKHSRQGLYLSGALCFIGILLLTVSSKFCHRWFCGVRNVYRTIDIRKIKFRSRNNNNI